MAVSPPYWYLWEVDRWAPGIWPAFSNAANWALSGLNVTLTSWWRTPETNASVGGDPGSQHLCGTAIDVAGPDQVAAANRLLAAGFHVVNEGTHVHAQVWPAGVARSSGLLSALGL